MGIREGLEVKKVEGAAVAPLVGEEVVEEDHQKIGAVHPGKIGVRRTGYLIASRLYQDNLHMNFQTKRRKLRNSQTTADCSWETFQMILSKMNLRTYSKSSVKLMKCLLTQKKLLDS